MQVLRQRSQPQQVWRAHKLTHRGVHHHTTCVSVPRAYIPEAPCRVEHAEHDAAPPPWGGWEWVPQEKSDSG